MKTHRYVRQVAQNELSEFETFPILQAISGLDLGPCHIDLGKLAIKYMDSEVSAELSPEEFAARECRVIGSRQCVQTQKSHQYHLLP